MNAKLWVGALLVVSLMVSSVGVVSAQEDSEGARRGFVGSVFSYDEGEGTWILVLVVQGENAGTSTPITVAVNPDIIKYPGQPSATQVAGTLGEGAKVAILARPEGDDWVAIQVVVKPVRPTHPPIVGAVVSRETDGNDVTTLTILRPNGTTKEIRLGPGASPPEIGEVVTAFAGPPEGAEGDEDGDGPPVVTGLVRAKEVRQRLNGFLQDLTTEDGALPGVTAQGRARALSNLVAALENHATHHVNILTSLSQREDLPSAAKSGMLNALQNAQRARDQALRNVAAARASQNQGRSGAGNECPNGVDGGGEDGECPGEKEGDGDQVGPGVQSGRGNQGRAAWSRGR